jgi:hypothetical protein
MHSLQGSLSKHQTSILACQAEPRFSSAGFERGQFFVDDNGTMLAGGQDRMNSEGKA